jgi:RAD51-like protein 2
MFDGVEGSCIYIDTEGSFVVERVVEIAEHFIQHLTHMANITENNSLDGEYFTLDKILSRIFYYRVHDYVEQIALVNLLPNIINQLPNVKLIVIDSVTFHFRHDFTDMSLRTRILTTMAQNLMSIAQNFNCSVILMNQMTTKVNGKESGSMLVPALGETWAHCCTNRIILYWKEGQRFAHLYKSPDRKSDTISYSVTEHGIR